MRGRSTRETRQGRSCIRNRSVWTATALGFVTVASLGIGPAPDGAVGAARRFDSSSAAETAVNCRAVSSRAMDALATTLRSAYVAASADASQNGSTGQYAVAATNSRDLIKRALDRAARMISDHNSSDPRTTTYAEAGTVKEHTRAIIEVLPQAAHWAVISNIYHNSSDARKAFDLASNALDQGRELFVDACNCYMDGYTP